MIRTGVKSLPDAESHSQYPRNSSSGLTSTNGAGDDILSAVPAIPDLIARGERLGDPLPPRNPTEAQSTRAWHVLGGTVRIDGRDVPMFAYIREGHAGHFFYDLGRNDGGAEPGMKAGDSDPAGPALARTKPAPSKDKAARDAPSNSADAEPTAAEPADDARRGGLFGDEPKAADTEAPARRGHPWGHHGARQHRGHQRGYRQGPARK